MNIGAYMISCGERDAIRSKTLANLSESDWLGGVVVELDQALAERRQDRQEITAFRALQRAGAVEQDFMMFLEDDLDFNRHLLHNLEHWRPLVLAGPGEHFFGSLYNPNIRIKSRESAEAFFIADPEAVYGSQAFVLSAATVRHILANWFAIAGMQDIKMSRLAAQVCAIHYHVPSLVQHMQVESLWGGPYHFAGDFDREWRASLPT